MTEEFDEEDDIFEMAPALAMVKPLCDLAIEMRWFSTVSEPLNAQTRDLAERYCESLGFPGTTPALLGNWEDAAAAAESGDYNSPAWEAEEQMRAYLSEEVLQQVDIDTLEMVMAHIAATVAEAATLGAEEAANFLRIDDMAFIQAATGAAVQSVHVAALVLMAGLDEDHPFSIRFHLFEQGRLPIGIMGQSFNIF